MFKYDLQFLYGEDGMDISRVQFMRPKHFQIIETNRNIVQKRQEVLTTNKQVMDNLYESNKMFNEVHFVAHDLFVNYILQILNSKASRSQHRAPYTSGFLQYCAQQPSGTDAKQLAKQWHLLTSQERDVFEAQKMFVFLYCIIIF
jgi:hypothetical protein